MRQQFCEVINQELAKTLCPWAAIIIEVEAGYLCFESVVDYDVWMDQE